MSAAVSPPQPLPAIADPQPFRWDRDTYYRMAAHGFLPETHVELIEGEILLMSPQNVPHVHYLDKLAEWLRESGWSGVWVRAQAPLNFGRYSAPEPDLSVVAGSRQDYHQAGHHPSSALLIVEISDTTLAYDRGKKASLYARFEVPDYWIVNVPDRQLEIYRDPQPDPSQSYGYSYRTRLILTGDAMISPLGAHDVTFRVSDLFA